MKSRSESHRSRQIFPTRAGLEDHARTTSLLQLPRRSDGPTGPRRRSDWPSRRCRAASSSPLPTGCPRENGYVATSIAAIAREADVAVQTIYNVVGSKADILSAVLDAHAQGPEAPRSVPEFLAERSGQAVDAEALLDMLADWFVEVHERTAPRYRDWLRASLAGAIACG
ncbi:TetR family transcriptional regulator [Agromyces bauzanensis]|uniref:TetR family transcriptional regulator n=1 Tax=Agromyces bauzanensis TaxID=1308924 RepID=UPI001665D470